MLDNVSLCAHTYCYLQLCERRLLLAQMISSLRRLEMERLVMNFCFISKSISFFTRFLGLFKIRLTFQKNAKFSSDVGWFWKRKLVYRDENDIDVLLWWRKAKREKRHSHCDRNLTMRRINITRISYSFLGWIFLKGFFFPRRRTKTTRLLFYLPLIEGD